jgi:hypothetical protein
MVLIMSNTAVGGTRILAVFPDLRPAWGHC